MKGHDPIRISQCMIVKNEEKNLPRALAWGRKMMWEQIVVDTGSTDRTAELAAAAGARVLHFQWIDDFAAAKNFALEQAAGDWIVFTDADEYFSEGEAEKIPGIVVEAEAFSQGCPCSIQTTSILLDSEGVPFSANVEERLFTNKRGIQYRGRIHECLVTTDRPLKKFNAQKRLSMYHKGYGKQEYQETGKIGRDQKLLLEELKEEPDNPLTLMYLGNGFMASGDHGEAERYLRESLAVCPRTEEYLPIYTFCYIDLLRILLYEREAVGEFLTLWEEAVSAAPDYPDFYLIRGGYEYDRKNWAEAVRYLEQAMAAETAYSGLVPRNTGIKTQEILTMLLTSSSEMGDIQGVFRHSFMALSVDRYNLGALICLLKTMYADMNADAGEQMDILNRIYHFDISKDRIAVALCARKAQNRAVEEMMVSRMTEEEWTAIQ